MAVQVFAKGAKANNANSTTIDFVLPASIPNGSKLLFVTASSSGGTATVSSISQVVETLIGSLASGTSIQSQLYEATVNSGDSGQTVSILWNTSSKLTVSWIILTGANSTINAGPVSLGSTDTGNTDVPLPDITPTAANAFLVNFINGQHPTAGTTITRDPDYSSDFSYAFGLTANPTQSSGVFYRQLSGGGGGGGGGGQVDSSNPPTFVGVTSHLVDSGATGDLVLAAPSGTVSGDRQFVFIGYNSPDVGPLAAPTGWTLIGSSTNPHASGQQGESEMVSVYTSTTDTGTATFVRSNSLIAMHAARTVYRGVHSISTPTFRWQNETSTRDTTHDIPDITTTVNNSRVFTALLAEDTGGATPRTFTSPTGFTQRYSDITTNEKLRVMVADVVKATAGLVTGTYTSSGNSWSTTTSIELVPGTAGGGEAPSVSGDAHTWSAGSREVAWVLALEPAGGTLTQSITDGMGLSDDAALSGTGGQFYAPDDSVGLTDSVQVARSLSLSFVDTVTLRDNKVDTDYSIEQSDNLGLTDIVTAAVIRPTQPEIFASGASANSATSTTISFTLPSQIPEDSKLLFAVNADTSTSTITGITGISPAQIDMQTGPSLRGYLYEATLQPFNSGLPVTVTWSGSGKISCAWIIVNGVNQKIDARPTPLLDGGGADPSVPIPPVAATVNNPLLVSFVSGQHDTVGTTLIPDLAYSPVDATALYSGAGSQQSTTVSHFQTNASAGFDLTEYGHSWSANSREISWVIALAPLLTANVAVSHSDTLGLTDLDFNFLAQQGVNASDDAGLADVQIVELGREVPRSDNLGITDIVDVIKASSIAQGDTLTLVDYVSVVATRPGFSFSGWGVPTGIGS